MARAVARKAETSTTLLEAAKKSSKPSFGPPGFPAFAGTMTMTWELRAVARGTEVVISADNVPVGISVDDHVTGMNASLDNLAGFVQAR